MEIFPAFQEASDIVKHAIMMGALNHCYGIRRISLDWFPTNQRNSSPTVMYSVQKGDLRNAPAVSNMFMPVLFADLIWIT